MEPTNKNIKKDWTLETIQPPREKAGSSGRKSDCRRVNETYSENFEHLPDRLEDIRILYLDSDPYNSGILEGYRLITKYTITTARGFAEAQQKLTETSPHLILVSSDTAQSDSIALFNKRMNNIPILILGRPQENRTPGVLAVDRFHCNPIDVYQLDRLLRDLLKNTRAFLQKWRIAERRIERDRRNLLSDRRQAELAYQRESELPQVKPVRQNFYRIDIRSKQVEINGRDVNLTRKEYELFTLLASDIGRVFSNEQLVDHIWGENSQATCSDVYQYIHLLRQKIEDDPKHPRWLLTIPGFGYKIAVKKS